MFPRRIFAMAATHAAALLRSVACTGPCSRFKTHCGVVPITVLNKLSRPNSRGLRGPRPTAPVTHTTKPAPKKKRRLVSVGSRSHARANRVLTNPHNRRARPASGERAQPPLDRVPPGNLLTGSISSSSSPGCPRVADRGRRRRRRRRSRRRRRRSRRPRRRRNRRCRADVSPVVVRRARRRGNPRLQSPWARRPSTTTPSPPPSPSTSPRASPPSRAPSRTWTSPASWRCRATAGFLIPASFALLVVHPRRPRIVPRVRVPAKFWTIHSNPRPSSRRQAGTNSNAGTRTPTTSPASRRRIPVSGSPAPPPGHRGASLR